MKLRATILLLLAGATAHAATWSDWWWTHDQQAQHALDAGKAAEAAQLFSDPRRRAYAELRAGKYTDAAKRLTPFDDAQSQYNRGNALAHAGDLQAALKAYDAALKDKAADTALHRDAQHNRDLVAKQLQQQRSQTDQSGKSGQSNKGEQAQSKDEHSKQNQQQANAASQSANRSGQQSSSQANAQRNASQSASADSSNAEQANAQQSNTSSASTDHAKTNQADNAQAMAKDSVPNQQQRDSNASAHTSSTPQSQQLNDTTKRETTQAQQYSGQVGSDASEARQQALQNPGAKPPAEQTLALDQWLRQIPDDPGGLLRRKFMIEHWMRQREAQQ